MDIQAHVWELGEREAERTAEGRYHERERAALLAFAVEVLADRSAHPAEHALARKRLTTRDLDLVDVDILTPEQTATLDVLLDVLIDGKPIGNEILRVIAEARPIESAQVIACASCKARAGRHYLDVTELDADTRAEVRDEIAKLIRGADD